MGKWMVSGSTMSRVSLGAMASLMTFSASANHAAKYRVVALENIPGGTYTVAAAINDQGQVAGAAYGESSCQHSCAAIWNDASPTLLGSLPAALGSEALGINDAGQVVGQVAVNTGIVRFQAVRWNWGKPTELEPLAGISSVSSAAYAINNAGQAVGNSDSGHGQQAAVWCGISPMSLDESTSGAFGINRLGQIVGEARVSGSGSEAVLWNGTTPTVLPTLGGAFSAARAINASSLIVGDSTTAGGAQHAVLWHRKEVIDLGTLGGHTSSAVAINERGDIVGTADTDKGVSHAVFWKHAGGEPVDLNKQIGPRQTARITLTDAVGINERCDIVANGYDNKTGDSRSFVLLVNDRGRCEWDGDDAQ